MTTPDNSRREYEVKLSLLLSSLSSIDLSGEIFDQSDHIYGRGGFGDVFTAKSRRHGGLMVAVKRLRVHILPEQASGAKMMLRELKIWSSVDHPNVLPLLGYIMHGPYPALVSPWMAKGSVRKYMDIRAGASMSYLAKGIASGLNYLHGSDIIHSDLKCDNILLSDSDVPMLADFGISRCISTVSISNSTSIKGSARWMAKEFFQVSMDGSEVVVDHSKETDIWAFGMVLYELLSGVVPYYHLKSDIQVSMSIIAGHTPSRPTNSAGLENNNKIWEIARECWRETASERPNMPSISFRLQDDYETKTGRFWSRKETSVESGAISSIPFDSRPVMSALLCRYSKELVVYDLRLPPAFAESYGYGFAARELRPTTYLSADELQEWACFPPRNTIEILASSVFPKERKKGKWVSSTASRSFKWKIKVLPSDPEPDSYVTILDVLKTLHDNFHSPLSPACNEFIMKAADSDDKRRAIGAFEARCGERAMRIGTRTAVDKGIGPTTTVEEERMKGVMCVDWFGWRRHYFGGLAPLAAGVKSQGGSRIGNPPEVWELSLCQYFDPNEFIGMH